MYSSFAFVFVLGSPCWSSACPARTCITAGRRRVRRGRDFAWISGVGRRGIGRRRDSAGMQGVTGLGTDVHGVRLESRKS